MNIKKHSILSEYNIYNLEIIMNNESTNRNG